MVLEDFIGLYELNITTGQNLANMCGKYNGCQAKVREQQPNALLFHCGSHIANL